MHYFYFYVFPESWEVPSIEVFIVELPSTKIWIVFSTLFPNFIYSILWLINYHNSGIPQINSCYTFRSFCIIFITYSSLLLLLSVHCSFNNFLMVDFRVSGVAEVIKRGKVRGRGREVLSFIRKHTYTLIGVVV